MPLESHEVMASKIFEDMIQLQTSQNLIIDNERSGELMIAVGLILVAMMVNDELDYAEENGRIIGKVILYIFIMLCFGYTYYKKKLMAAKIQDLKSQSQKKQAKPQFSTKIVSLTLGITPM